MHKIDRYIICNESCLYSSNNSNIYYGYDETNINIEVAIKIVNLNSYNADKINIIKKYIDLNINDNNNVIKYYGYFFLKNHFYIVMELCDIFNLSEINIINNIPLQQQLYNDLVNGIYHLYKNKIIHCNINPSKILYSNNSKSFKISCFETVFFIDFWTNNLINTEKYKEYVSNELINNLPFNYKTDIFSFGKIIKNFTNINNTKINDSFTNNINERISITELLNDNDIDYNYFNDFLIQYT